MGTRANVQVNRGVLYIAPTGEALTEYNNLTPPAVTISPAGNWVAIGFSDEDNHMFDIQVEWQLKYCMENLGPIKIICIKEGGTFSVKFIESDLAALNKAQSARTTLSTVAAGADQTAQDLLKFGDKASTTEKALLYLSTSPEAGSRIIHMPYVVTTGGISWPMGKQSTGYDVEFTMIADATASAGETLLKIIDITAAASS